MERKPTRWKVELQSAEGTTGEVVVKSYWDPERPGIKADIGQAAAIEQWMKAGKQMTFEPVKVTRVGERAPA